MRFLITTFLFMPVFHVILISRYCESSPLIQGSCGGLQRYLPVKAVNYHNDISSKAQVQSCHHLKESNTPDSITSPAIADYRTHKIEPRTDRSSTIERSVTSNVTSQGYRWFWIKAEVISNSADAYNEHHNLYHQIENYVRPTGDSTIGFAAKMVITYGAMRMTFINLPNDQASAAEFIQWFAQEMIRSCILGQLYATYEIAVWTGWAILWVLLQINAPGHIPDLIT